MTKVTLSPAALGYVGDPLADRSRSIFRTLRDQAWMQQMARNATGEAWGFLDQRRYVLHDRDTKFCSLFQATLTAGGIEPIQLPARSPNLNAFAERWVRSVKAECLSKLILFW
jgi:putative transposase